MSQTAHLDPETATTDDLRGLLARERITKVEVARHTTFSRSALTVLLQRPAAIDPDLNREVLAAIEKVKAGRK